MSTESPLVIEDREELIFMLSEAAALEHMIMCEYLFAAFSLKCDVSEGVTAAQLAAIKHWERVVALVATQEMLHLALVSNLLTAIGSHPFLSHPNFPQRSKYYPPGVQLALLSFGEHALQHFLYLERPEGMDLEDAPEFAVQAIPKPSLTLEDDQVVPRPRILQRLDTSIVALSRASVTWLRSTANGASSSVHPARKRPKSTSAGPN